MTSTLLRRLGLPALFLSGAVVGSTLTGTVFAMQPHMQSALTALRSARYQLNAAYPDKAGHRVRALQFTQSAINETRAGMAAGAM